MKKNIIYLLAGVFALMTSCQDPEYVQPTADRQGITSLTALFTSGPYVDKEAAIYTIGDASLDKYVIPIPWFFPEDSENATTEYMKSMRVQAVLAPNCTIEPALTILDLTKENYFTYTDAQGYKKQICIIGERVKSNKCQLLSFSLELPELSGIIDEDNKTISLISADDLSACLADYSLSAHATISPDIKNTPNNYNEPFKVTVTAHNGVTKAEYTVKKEVPAKIAYGYRKGSEKNVFSVDLTGMGLPTSSHPTLGVIGKYLVVSYGNGDAPLYLDRTTGTKIGQIKLGSAKSDGSIVSDANSNLLISNYASSGSNLLIYRTKSVTEDPKEYIRFSNTTGLPVGSRLSITGNLDANAIITAVCDGPGSNKFVRWIVTNGTVGNAEVISVSGVSTWNGMDGNAKIAYRSTSVSDGYFVAHYDGGNDNVYFVNGNTNTSVSNLSAQSDGSGWASNNGTVAVFEFNNAKYMTMYSIGYFPQWSCNSVAFMYDVTSVSSFSGAVDTTDLLSFKFAPKSYNGAEPAEPRTGDVLLISANGYNLNLYCIDSSCKTLEAYEFDCIDK